MNHLDFIIKFESGETDFEEVIEGFQSMIDDGTVWELQGFYGRTAMDLIDSGQCEVSLQHLI